MSSVRTQTPVFSRKAATFAALLTACAIMLGALAGDASAAKSRKSASATKKLPVVTRVAPMTVKIGQKLTISGKYIVKGKNSMRVLFQRVGSSRRFSARGNGLNTKSVSVVVPSVAADMPGGQPAIFRIRLISKYGASKAWTRPTISPTVELSEFDSPLGDTSSTGDCDRDGQINGVDIDDDNDLLVDTTELAIGTLPCNSDTDGDGPTDYYEHRVALEWNNGLADRIQVLPYPKLAVYPNPTKPDSENDLDGDGLMMMYEYQAWQFTKRMDRFYSDADQDSDNDLIFDDDEDEDGDLLPNDVELFNFGGFFPLDWLITDTDGDGLCDGLDDQDEDGPPTAVGAGDCTTPVPNNGTGDPDPLRIDGDDNVYSNWYEWAYGIGFDDPWYDPCNPSPYGIGPGLSPSCPHS